MDIIRPKPKLPEKIESAFTIGTTEYGQTDSPHRQPPLLRPPRPRKSKKIFFLVGSAIFLLVAILGYGFFFSWQIHRAAGKIQLENQGSSWLKDVGALLSPIVSGESTPLKGEAEGRINILLLGRSGENNSGKNLTDTLMTVSIDTKNKKISLISLPRDLYVNIPDTHSFTKINSVFQYSLNQNRGTDLIDQAVENVLGIPIHYTVIVDFAGFKKVIDDIGGVTVSVERDIFDPRYPGPNYSYETFEIKKGVQNLDGATALKYARERHADPDGDFGRARRQQQILQAVKSKVFSLETFLNVFTLDRLLATLADHLQTNIGLSEAEGLISLVRTLDTQNISNVVVDAWERDSLLKVSHVMAGSIRAFILVPRVGNFSEIQELAQNSFDINILKERQALINQENPRIAILNQSTDPTLASKIKTLLEDKLKTGRVSIVAGQQRNTRSQTAILDQTKKQKVYTLDELVKKLGATLSTEPIDDILKSTRQDFDFIILLGDDLADTHRYEEDSIDDYRNAEPEQNYVELINQK